MRRRPWVSDSRTAERSPSPTSHKRETAWIKAGVEANNDRPTGREATGRPMDRITDTAGTGQDQAKDREAPAPLDLRPQAPAPSVGCRNHAPSAIRRAPAPSVG